MKRNQRQFLIPTLCAAAGLLLAGGINGCRVQVDKSADGEGKRVQVDTPFGGVQVRTNGITAADLGLPAYPGAQIMADKGNDKSADVQMGFGEWELQVKAVNYSAPDSQTKVEDFYKKALARYGDVISCKDDKPVGTAAITSEGLTCSDDHHNRMKVQANGDEYPPQRDGFELKAGSNQHQHIVAFESAPSGQTRFSLVAVDLPAFVDQGSGKSD